MPGHYSDALEYNERPATAPTMPAHSDLDPCAPLRSDSPPPAHHLYPLAFHTLDSSESSAGPRLRSSMDSNYACFPSLSSLPESIPKPSAIGPLAPTPTLLTEELLDAGDKTVAGYEAVRMQYFEAPPEIYFVMISLRERLITEPQLPPINPFRSDVFDRAALERYFVAAADVKNILQLRHSVVMADIGDTLALLVPRMSLYAQDDAHLETVVDELELIREASSIKRHDLSFLDLEFSRRSFPQHPPSVLEEHSGLFDTLWRTLRQKDGAQEAARIFLKDPSSLWEHRLPLFGSSRR